MMVRTRRIAALLLASWLVSSDAAAEAGSADAAEWLRFGAEMARQGSWREARFRWERAAAVRPDDPRILNNLAVADEALGAPGSARERYERASRLAPRDETIADNLSRLRRFLARAATADERESAATADPADESAARGDIRGSKTWKVSVRLPVPARLDLAARKRVLVASFLTPDDELLDVNSEAVRFVRSELRKHSPLSVLDVTPAPAVPEQTIDDLADNAEFWKHLGREHEADLIVSGQVRFRRADASGFREVDSVSPVTGQKVRQTKFVEQERFDYEMTILFVDGADGAVLQRDRMRKGSVFVGLANDPISAFFDLIQATAADLLANVSPGTREETRRVFRR